MVIDNIATSEGDVLLISADVAAVGLLTLQGFVDSTANESGQDVFTKTFRYSLDGINYSDWLPLTNANIQAVPVHPKDSVLLQYRYKKTTSSDAPLQWNSTTVNATYDSTKKDCGYYFQNSIFEEFFDCNNFEVLNWYLNVTAKMYQTGLVADFIDRTNSSGSSDDYIFFWKAISKFFAYFVVYARTYQKFYTNQNLLTEYLRERGLEVSQYDQLESLYYLMSTFPQQMYNRGTKHIVDLVETGSQANGEFARHVAYKAFDEFLFNLYLPQDIGWNLTNSSPLYRGLRGQQNINKFYEKNNLLLNLNLYPLVNRSHVSIQNDASVSKSIINFDATSGETGIGNTSEYKPIKVDSSLDYEISFYIKKSAGSTFNFGVKSYDVNDNLLTNLSNLDNNASDFFVQGASFSRTDEYIFVRGIIYNWKKPNFTQDLLNINVGHNLIFKPAAKKIVPYITITSGNAQIYDVQILPLFTLYSRGLIQVKNFISSWVKNNKTGLSQDAKKLASDNTQVIYNPNTEDNEIFTSKYLIPYNSHIKINNIGDYYYKDQDTIVKPVIQVGYRPINYSCAVDSHGNKTGIKTYSNIEQYNLATNIATGFTYGNDPSNLTHGLPYFPPVTDLATCAPIRPKHFVGINPYCEQQYNQTANLVGYNNPQDMVYGYNSNYLYISDTGSNSVKVLDPAQNLIIQTIPVGSTPRQIIHIPLRHVICVKLQNGNIAVINESTFAVTYIASPTLTNYAPSLVYCTFSDALATVDNTNGIAYVFNFSGTVLQTITGVPNGLFIAEEATNGTLYINQSANSTSSNSGTNVFIVRKTDTSPYQTISISTVPGDFGSTMGYDASHKKLFTGSCLGKNVTVISTATDARTNIINTPLSAPGYITYQATTNAIFIGSFDNNTNTIYSINPTNDTINFFATNKKNILTVAASYYFDTLFTLNLDGTVSKVPNVNFIINTGNQAYANIQQYYSDDNTPVVPNFIQLNTAGIPSYQPPIVNTGTCPIPPAIAPVTLQINDEVGPLSYQFTDHTSASGNLSKTTSGSGQTFGASGSLVGNDSYSLVITGDTSHVSRIAITVNQVQHSYLLSDLATLTFIPGPGSTVIVTAKGSVAQYGNVTGIPNAYSQADVTPTQTLWISQTNGTVSVVDENTQNVIQQIATGSVNPLKEIVYIPNTNTVWVKDQQHTIYVIDASSYAVIRTLTPSTAAYSIGMVYLSDLNKVYNISANGFVDVWNTTTYALTTTISGFGHQTVQGVYDLANKFVYITSYNGTVSKVNATTDSLVGSIILGASTDYIYGPAIYSNYLYCLNATTAQIYIVELVTFTLFSTMASGGPSPFRMRFSSSRNLLYICYTSGSQIRTLDPTTNTLGPSIPITASGATDLIYVPTNSKLYIMGYYSNNVVIVT